MVEWETDEITYEPLKIIIADDPATCAIYGKNNNLLDEEGWKRLKPIARRQPKLLRLANQAKLRSFRLTLKQKYVYEVPRNYSHAKEIDLANGNTK